MIAVSLATIAANERRTLAECVIVIEGSLNRQCHVVSRVTRINRAAVAILQVIATRTTGPNETTLWQNLHGIASPRPARVVNTRCRASGGAAAFPPGPYRPA